MRLAVGVGLDAGDERVQVAVGALQEALAAGRQVERQLGRVQGQRVEVDDVDVGAQPGSEQPAVEQADRLRRARASGG